MVALNLLLACATLGADSQTVLLNFTSPQCSHCQTMQPLLAQLAAGGATIETIDVTRQPELARKFQVTGTPTFIMLAAGREAGRIVGSTTAQKLQAMFPQPEAAIADTLRGQSPDVAEGNYVGQRLGGLFGKGSPPAAAESPTSRDPFADRPAPEEEPIRAAGAARSLALENSQNTENPQERAMAASVRLKVEDSKGYAIGSGTIIDQHGNEAALITCGHIFRDSEGKGKILVDLFHPQPRTVEGKLIAYDLKRDIAIVSIVVPEGGVTAASVAHEGITVNKADAAFSIGCNKGQDPTLRTTQIRGLNRYQGPPNIEAAGAPVDGRSGGGLFSREGFLIGVCNAADEKDDEGIYAAMGTIHWQLKEVGLEELYRQPAIAPLEAVVEVAPPQELAPLSVERNAVPQVGNDTELICFVRSKTNPAAKGKVFVINRASTELLEQLAAGSSDPALAADLALQGDRRAALSPTARTAERDSPIVRGQSRH